MLKYQQKMPDFSSKKTKLNSVPEEELLIKNEESDSLRYGGELFLYLLLSVRVHGQDPKSGSELVRGATETKVHEFPMVVGLVDAEMKIVFCGGTIIARKWILTSALCLEKREVSNLGILYGAHNYNNAHETADVHGLVRARRMLKHPDAMNYLNDIGLVETAKRIPFNNRVRPAYLPFSVDNRPCIGQSIIAVGWGAWFLNKTPPGFLRKMKLKIVDQSVCTYYTGQVVAFGTICTYPAGKRMACEYDFGAPLLREGTAGRTYVIGITAGAFGCAANNTPGLHTRVAPFLSWIKTATGGLIQIRKNKNPLGG